MKAIKILCVFLFICVFCISAYADSGEPDLSIELDMLELDETIEGITEKFDGGILILEKISYFIGDSSDLGDEPTDEMLTVVCRVEYDDPLKKIEEFDIEFTDQGGNPFFVAKEFTMRTWEENVTFTLDLKYGDWQRMFPVPKKIVMKLYLNQSP